MPTPRPSRPSRPSGPVRPAGPGRPVRPARVLAAALTLGTLFATAACSDGDDSASSDSGIAVSPVAERTEAAATTTPATPSATVSLTPSSAKTALITEGDLEDSWNQVDNASTWHDSLLVGKVDTADFLSGKTQAADCQRLPDSLYDDTVLGKPSGASALTGFEEGDSRLLYQVAAYQKDDLDKSFAWLGSLTDECDQFSATASDGSQRTVQVVEASLPRSGDAREGVTVTVQGKAGGAPVTLTLDVAAVRVGTDAITITNGGPDGVDHDSTKTAVQLGTQRLKDVQAGRTPAPEPDDGQQD